MVLSPGIKQLGCEVDYLPPLNAEVEDEYRYVSPPPAYLYDVP